MFALAGLTALAWFRPAHRHAMFLTGFFVSSFLAVCVGLYFRSHYFVLMLPAVALLAGLGVTALTDLCACTFFRRIPIVLFVFACCAVIYKNANYYFYLTPTEACRAVYGNAPFSEAIAVGTDLRQRTSPADRIAVLGSEPEIYFYAHRLSATGYIYVYSLMENQPYWPQMQAEMIKEVEYSRPLYAIFVNDTESWFTRGATRQGPLLNWANTYLRANYVEVQVVDVGEHREPLQPLQRAATHSRHAIEIYKRIN
jgi:hypothetical protein